ncbi:BTAD domain-containing putative transcriptional regulator [Streptomyces violaceusniger]|uniref:AfsR/SARP family transcriptional regulator n=1 Tax=Streptomyces violaceusniger TaxID=68280 RepID=UPI003430EE01
MVEAGRGRNVTKKWMRDEYRGLGDGTAAERPDGGKLRLLWGARVEFRVLGPLEVRDQGHVIDLGAPRTRLVCGLLLVRPGALVAVERLVDELWPDQPPPDARALVRGYVSRLRRALRSGPSGADWLITRKPGYLLRDQDLDLHRFERLVAEARAARQAGQPEHAFELFGHAQQLWRGEAFADVPHTASIVATCTWLTEQRLTTTEERFDAALEAGQNAEVITMLTEFVATHPLRERPAGQLMLALYRCGRQSEALECYQRTRGNLADEVGVDPGVQLQKLHQQILGRDPIIAPPTVVASPPTARPVTRPVPRQLPFAPGSFTERSLELSEVGVAPLRGSAELPVRWPGLPLGGSPPTVAVEEAVAMVSLIDELEAREAAARGRVEALESRIAEVTERLEAEREVWSRLRVTRETVVQVAAEMSARDTAVQPVTESPARAAPTRTVGAIMVPHWRKGLSVDVLPDVYRDIVEVMTDTTGPMQAKQIAPRIGLPAALANIEETQNKLKRLVERGWLTEDQPGLFTLAHLARRENSEPAER